MQCSCCEIHMYGVQCIVLSNFSPILLYSETTYIKDHLLEERTVVFLEKVHCT
jgi:hypothetical protein